jgi:hypothetical protein
MKPISIALLSLHFIQYGFRFRIHRTFWIFIASILITSVSIYGEEPGFVVFATGDNRISSLGFFNNACVLFQPLMNPNWATPETGGLEDILSQDIHKLTFQALQSDDKKTFQLPGNCRRSRIWVLVPEAQLALGTVISEQVDGESAHLNTSMQMRLILSGAAASRLQKMEPGRRFHDQLEQLVWRVYQTEGKPDYAPSPVYGLQVHTEKGLVSPVPSLLREIALSGELEKAATNGARQILDLLALQSLDDRWLVNLISRIPDPMLMMSTRVSIPETNASIEIPATGTAADLRIVDNHSRIALNLQQARILQIRMPRGCSIRVRDNSNVVLVKPDRGVIAIPDKTEDICSVISAAGSHCKCQSASREIVELSVSSPADLRKTGTTENAPSYGRSCIWDSKCAIWTTVTGDHQCTIRPLSCDVNGHPRIRFTTPPNCSVDPTGNILCDLKDEAAGTDDCNRILGDQWSIFFPELSGLPLCQSLPR